MPTAFRYQNSVTNSEHERKHAQKWTWSYGFYVQSAKSFLFISRRINLGLSGLNILWIFDWSVLAQEECKSIPEQGVKTRGMAACLGARGKRMNESLQSCVVIHPLGCQYLPCLLLTSSFEKRTSVTFSSVRCCGSSLDGQSVEWLRNILFSNGPNSQLSK